MISFIALLAMSAPAGATELKVHPLISDGAVVLADSPIPVWGRGRIGSTITVSCGGAVERTTSVASDGCWRVELPALKGGSRTTITVRDDQNETVTASDVLAGEVWLAAGQSNMVLPLKETEGAEAEAPGADLPQVRIFWVPQKTSVVPLDWTLGGTWQRVSPVTAKDFSAVAYYFAKHLHGVRHKPVGMVVAAWGGTPISAWLNTESLGGMPEFVKPLAERTAAVNAFDRAWPQWTESNTIWMTALAGRDSGVSGHWESPAFSDADWPVMRLPARWEERDPSLKGFMGSLWLRRNVMIPADWSGLDLCLFLDCVSDYAEVWVDGHRVHQDGPGQRGVRGSWRRIRVPATAFTAGRENLIAVDVISTQGKGGVHSQWAFQIAPWDGAPQVTSPTVTLHETAWRWKVGARCDGVAGQTPPPVNEPALPDGPGQLAVLADGMISAIDRFPIRGALWYQGESDVGRESLTPPLYRLELAALIAEWRTRWQNPGLPVLIVQLPQNGKAGPSNQGGGWPRLREAQSKILSLPRVGLAVTMDTCPDGNLHPRMKRPVGDRLGLLARRIAYGEKIHASGPVYAGFAVDGGRLRLRFTSGGSALRAGPRGEVLGCCVAGADRKFVPAQARIEGKTVVVRSDVVPSPVAARYAWCDNTECNLADASGLPAAPFRMDDW